MSIISRKLFLGLGWLGLLVHGLVDAAVIPVPGSSFEVADATSGAVQVPPKWKLVGGEQEACSVWRLGEASGFLLKSGVELEVEIAVPALSEKEEELKGEWMGVVHLDYVGLAKSGESRVSMELRSGDIVVQGKRVQLTRPVATREAVGGVGGRQWMVVPAEKLAPFLGQKVALRVSCGGPEGLVVSGVGMCRVHSAPTTRLMGKANGHLGPDLLGVGSLGFEALTVHEQHALQVLTVREDGPAAVAGLEVGDVILEVNRRPLPENNIAPGWEWFGQSHEAVLGRAVEEAGRHKQIVELGILRGGETKRLQVKLGRLMEFTTMIPETDPTAAAMHQDLLDFLVRTQREDGSWSRDPIRTAFSALALLATRDATHGERVKRAVDYLLNRYPEAENFGNLGFWHASYAGMLYSEYYLATGDERVLGRMEDIRDWALTGTHTSKWGMPALGHGITGLPYGQKALMAPLAHLVVYEALARRGGMESGIWEELFPYIEYSWSDPAKKDGRGNPGHGAMGYNASYKDLGEFWSRTGLCAMACQLRGEHPEMRDAMVKVMRERHPWIRNSHAYGEPGGSLGLLGLNLSAPEVYEEVIAEYGWWFSLAWEPGYGLRFTTPHMGAPYMGTDDLINATYALVLAGPSKTLHMTGATDRNWLDVSEMPTPVSEVRVKRSKEGMVSLEGRIPGLDVYYRLDGKEPTKRSEKYAGPFLVDGAATLTARVIPKRGEAGPLVEKTFAPAKAKWQVVAASGHVDRAEALRRADRAIDGDPNKCWLTDNGEGATGYPHHLVLDLSEAIELPGLSLWFGHKSQVPGKWIVKASLTADEPPVTVAEGEWEEFATSREIRFEEPVQARFLRFEALSGIGAGEGATSLLVREIDLLD